MKWTKEKALDAIYRNCKIIIYGNIVYILSGSAGNRILGAINYLQRIEKYPIEIIDKIKFEILQKKGN